MHFHTFGEHIFILYWLKKTKISLSRKLMIYEAQVVSIIIYNCNSWAAPTASFNYLDVTHRRHLRSILNIKWPTGFINNSDLYKRCDTTPLSTRVAAFRWRMLGHTLRGVEGSPAYLSMLFAIKVLMLSVMIVLRVDVVDLVSLY